MGKMYPGEDDYRAEDDMQTLTRAQEVKNDPERMAKAKEMAKKKMREMQQVANSGSGNNDAESFLQKGYRKLNQ